MCNKEKRICKECNTELLPYEEEYCTTCEKNLPNTEGIICTSCDKVLTNAEVQELGDMCFICHAGLGLDEEE